MSPCTILAPRVGVWFVLGCIIETIPILLLTVPVCAPVAVAVGSDPIAVVILGMLAIETGLPTLPIGILVFTVKPAVADEPGLSVAEIFAGSLPEWLVPRTALIALAQFPHLASWLPAWAPG